MIQYAPFCKKQADYIQRSAFSWLNVAEGGKRAGKNITNLIAWAMSIETHPDRLHLAAGVSQSSAKMNILDSDGFGLQWIFAGRCRMGQVNGRDALIIASQTGEKVVIIAGGGDSRSASLIKGHSYGTAYITEVNECHPTFVEEVFDRTLASGKRQLFFDLNPKPPRHWFYADILDYQDALKAQGQNPGYNYEHFTIADNRSISREALLSALAKYDRSSIWYQRDIEGKRVSASGRIYTGYSYKAVAVTPEQIRGMRFKELAVGVDVGGTDATVATLCGLTQGFKEVVLIDGMYDKQGISDKMDEATYAKMVVEWLIPWAMVYPLLGVIYCDSANKLFRRALEKELISRGMGRFIVRAFNKADGILPRIELNSMLLSMGRFKISSAMRPWHDAYQNATWSMEAYERGEWERTDDGSYPVDALDSAEYGFYGFKRYLV